MAILAFATSPAELYEGNPSDVGTTTNYKAPYVNEGIFLDNFGTTLGTLDFATTTDFWLSFYIGFNADQSTDGEGPVRVYADNGDMVMKFGCSSYRDMDYYYDIGAGMVKFGEHRTSGSVRFDMNFVTDGTSGSVAVYVNGTLDGEVTGLDTTNGGTRTGVNQVEIRPIIHNGAPGTNTYISAIMCADEDLRNAHYVQIRPGSAGSNSDWTGSYTDVDESGFNDNDAISANNSNEISTFNISTVTTDFDTGYDVIGVGVSSRSWGGAASSSDVSLVARSGTTDGSGSTKTIGVAKKPYQSIFSVNPDTSTAWTISEAKAAEIGIKIV